MRKKLFARLVVSLFAQVLVPAPALAAVVVSEIMYDPAGTDTGREWVEIWNDASSDFDLGAAFLLEGGTSHKVAPFGGVPALVPAGGYAIVADKPESFLADYQNVTPVFDSAFSLSNSGERIALVDAGGGEFSSAEWNASAGATDGKSWQRAGVSWIAASATPTARNADREDPPAAASSSSPAVAAISAHSGTGGLTTVRREAALEVDAGRDRIVPVGAELAIEPETEGVARASYSWSWGDGAASRGRRGRHSYRFPGTYAVVLNAKGTGGATATSRATVVVVEAQVSLAATDGEDGSVAILSRSPHELNLGGFLLNANGESFELPRDTIIFPSGRIDVPNALSELLLAPPMGASSTHSASIAAPTSTVTLRRPDGKPVANL